MGILIENLSFHYTGTPVLDQVNLEVKDGDYAILTGENGSGKSTFLKLLLGELKAQEGSITVNGKDISAHSEREIWDMFHRTVSAETRIFRRLWKRS